MSDPRFAAKLKQPIFKKPKKEANTVTLDDRFQQVLTDEKFHIASSSSVDKYGRKNKKNKLKNNELKEIYQTNEEFKEAERAEIAFQEHKTKGNNNNIDIDSRLDYLNRLARGEVTDSSNESENENNEIESESENDNESIHETHNKSLMTSLYDDSNDIDSDLELEIPETNRIALQNCDWDNLHAKDIL